MSSQNLMRRLEVMAEKDFVTLEDGYVYFFPSRNGGLSAPELRVIADILDERNAAWDAVVHQQEQKEPQG